MPSSRILQFRLMSAKKPTTRSKQVIEDPREAPLYSLSEAAFFVGIPATTLQKWVYGRDYAAKGEIRHSPRVIVPADAKRGLLSFANLAEAHVLESIRKHRFSLSEIRDAVDEIRRQFPSEQKHPLLSGDFFRYGKGLFIKTLNETISVSRPTQGQPTLGDLLDTYLDRITRDDRDRPVRLFPMRRNERSAVMVDLFIASGQPVITDTGILAEFLYERHKTGESIAEIATDYGLDERIVADAIRYIAA